MAKITAIDLYLDCKCFISCNNCSFKLVSYFFITGISLWNIGKEAPETRFLQEDNPELSAEKLSMVSAVQLTIAAGLTILGVAPIDEM